MALSSGQKICYAIILILTILLAGLIFATATKGYHNYSEANNFRNKNDFGYSNSFIRILQQIDPINGQIIIPGNNVVIPIPGTNQQTFITPGTAQQQFVVPGTNQQIIVPGVNQQTVVVPSTNQQTVVVPGNQTFVNPNTQTFVNPNTQTFITPGTNTKTIINPTIAQAIVGANRTFINGTNVQTYIPGAGPYVTLPDGSQVQRNYLTAN